MDPSFVQEETEGVDDFAVRFTEARVKCERASQSLGLGARSETDYGFLFRQKVLPYLQADLQRFDVKLDQTADQLTDKLRGFERALLTSNQVQNVSQMRQLSAKRHAGESVDSQNRAKVQRVEPVQQVSMLSAPSHNDEVLRLRARVAEQETELQRRRDACRLAQENKLRVQHEQDNNLAIIAQITEVVRSEMRGNQQWHEQQGRSGGPRADMRCNSCQEHGHVARDCRQGGQQQQSRPGPRNCHRCGMQRHRPPAWECPAYQSQCGRCGGRGHFEEVCPERRAHG